MGSVSAWPERAIEVLVEGQEYTNQHQILFHNPSSSQGTGHLSLELIEKMLRSFDQALAELTSVEVSQSRTVSNEDSSIDSSRRPPASKGKRGCYKRKRSAEAWTVVSATMEDGHAWRKYGQKEILNSEHPRSYFRCTRKYDQGCGAIKQVQRMEDGSQMYRTTYIGTHTCTDYSPPLIMTNSGCWETGAVKNGVSEIPIKRQHDQQWTSVDVKQETKEETSSDVTDMWKDLMGDGFEYCSEPAGMLSNVYPSCTELNFELGFGIKPMEFENDFEFDAVNMCGITKS